VTAEQMDYGSSKSAAEPVSRHWYIHTYNTFSERGLNQRGKKINLKAPRLPNVSWPPSRSANNEANVSFSSFRTLTLAGRPAGACAAGGLIGRGDEDNDERLAGEWLS